MRPDVLAAMPERLPDHGTDGVAPSPHDLPRVVIVGAGQTGRELARQLAGERQGRRPRHRSAKKLESAPGGCARTRPSRSSLRDGTSALALRAAARRRGGVGDRGHRPGHRQHRGMPGCRRADPAAIATVGTLRESHRTGTLRATGAESIARPGVIASQIRNRIERSHQVATSLGLGRGEIREIQVLPTSPAVNVKLRDLGARKWLVAGIYRGGPFRGARRRRGDRRRETGFSSPGSPKWPPARQSFSARGSPCSRSSSAVTSWSSRSGPFRKSPGGKPSISSAPHARGDSGSWRPRASNRPADLRRCPADQVWPASKPGDDRLRGGPSGRRLRPDRPRRGVLRGADGPERGALPLAPWRGFSCPVLIPGGSFPWERLVDSHHRRGSAPCAPRTRRSGCRRQFSIPLAAVLITPPSFIGRGLEEGADMTSLPCCRQSSGWPISIASGCPLSAPRATRRVKSPV